MKEHISRYLSQLSRKSRSSKQKIFFLGISILFFGILLPLILNEIGERIEKVVNIGIPPGLEVAIVITSLTLGAYFILATIYTQWKVGLGTPALNAPTKKLITSGPFKLCRNPLQLSGMLYYLGIGTWVNTIITGLFSLVVALVWGIAYHKGIEEKELQLRFGKEYEEYKKGTPFLIPFKKRVK